MIEATLTMAIVGVGIMAALQMFGACTSYNHLGNQMTTARMLAENIQEATAGMKFSADNRPSTPLGAENGEALADYDDVDDFNGSSDHQVFNPPIDAMRQAIPELSRYSQDVSVVWVNEHNPDGFAIGSNAKRVTVRVLYQSSPQEPAREVHQVSWIVMNQYE